jgi:hypothetical protein
MREIDTTALLERARELDPPAWAAPLLKRLGRRRDCSVVLAFKELLAVRRGDAEQCLR